MEDGETVTLESPGALSVEALGRWRIGEWIKTDRRMLFVQAGDVRCRVETGALMEISPCEREYSFNKRRCLRIVFNEGCDLRTLWLITPDIRRWEDGLSSYLKNSLTEEDIVKVAHHLSLGAEKILWHLYRKRHATIAEIAETSGSVSHMEALNLIRNEVNRVSKEIIGRPVLVFRQEGDCPSGCQKVAYSWWFVGCKAVHESPFCDVINEGEYYRIIVESPPDANVKITDGQLCVQDDRGFSHSVPLPPGASKTILNKSYSNGILDVGVLKQT